MKDLTKGNELKTIIYFSLPILIGNLFSADLQYFRHNHCGKFFRKGKPCGCRLKLSN